jgi:hypothetical protein
MKQVIRERIVELATQGHGPLAICQQFVGLDIGEVKAVLKLARKKGDAPPSRPQRRHSATPHNLRIPADIFAALKPHADGLGRSVAAHAAELLRAALSEPEGAEP